MSSRSSSSSRSRRSSSPPCLPSTSARPSSRSTKEEPHMLALFTPLLGAVDDGADAGKAIALALGVGLGALGAGVGIGNIFGSMIQAVARQPELRGELQGIQWLGFALTEAVVFYGLIGGLLAYALISVERRTRIQRRDQGRPGADDLDADRLRDHVLRAQGGGLQADPEDHRRPSRPDPARRRGGGQRPRRGTRPARAEPRHPGGGPLGVGQDPRRG